MQISIYGARGSIPTCGAEFNKYGGNTTCVCARSGGYAVLLDAGTGIRCYHPAANTLILMSHYHADHVHGLPFFKPLYEPGAGIRIIGARRNELSCREQISRFLSPPVWPFGTEMFKGAGFSDLDIGSSFDFGPFLISSAEGNHPGGCTVFRLTAEGKSLVFATDFEATQESESAFIKFASGCNLLIMDGQYTDTEYSDRRGWGHSAYTACLRIFKSCGADNLIITHHDYTHTDGFVDNLAKGLPPRAAFAAAGTEITL